MRLLILAWPVLSLLAQRQPRPLPANLPETNPYASPADVETGGKLYSGRCGHCHGQSGEGGRGAVLNSGRLRRPSSDRDLFSIIRAGIPGTEMPGAFNLPEPEIWRMVAHVKQLGRQGASELLTGNAAAGLEVYRKSGCAQCHRIEGQGGFLGPDLTDAGAKRAARHLRESVVNPSADIPLDYRSVAVTTVAGQTVSGIHLNEDEYSVHLQDLSGNPRSFLKRDLKQVRLPRESTMPAYSTLPPADVENLVAYLARRGSSTLWTFDRLDSIGGHKTTVLGQPRVIDSPAGKAVEFDGVDDALFIDDHPLAGADTYTWEAIFRPDGGQTEQRWFHLSERGSENRMLFEIRVAGDQWYLDSFNQTGSVGRALMNRQKLHPLGRWVHVACVYDGREFRSYVDGVREESASPLQFAPQGPGQSSVGVRINKVFYFKGAVRLARFTGRALEPSEFLRPPDLPR
ncbi:MAG: c-type cytochrome [Bryobacteraceae bacterium]